MQRLGAAVRQAVLSEGRVEQRYLPGRVAARKDQALLVSDQRARRPERRCDENKVLQDILFENCVLFIVILVFLYFIKHFFKYCFL